MTIAGKIAMACSAALLAFSASAQEEHDVHHPADKPIQTAAAQAPVASAPMPALSAQMPALSARQRADMLAIHNKLMAAKTPQERQALMSQYWQAMPGGMGNAQMPCPMMNGTQMMNGGQQMNGAQMMGLAPTASK